MYWYIRLDHLCKHMPEYDGHAVHGLVDEDERPVLATFIHRVGVGVPAQEGGVADSCGGARWLMSCYGRANNPREADVAAFTDGLRLSRGMSFKSALLDYPIGAPLGGAKTVVFGHNIGGHTVRPDGLYEWPWEVRTRIWKPFAREVLVRVPGHVTAEDSGSKCPDMAYIKGCLPSALVSGHSEATDPCPVTARGVYIGIKTALCERYGPDWSVRDTSFAFQGVGGVGAKLLQMLWADGAHNIAFSEISEPSAEAALRGRKGLRRVPVETIYDVECDVFVPCALGGILNAQTISRLQVQIVAGPANNQLLTQEDGWALHRRGILYAPDYGINAGGLADVLVKVVTGESAEAVLPRVGDNLRTIFTIARERNLPTSVVADELAKERIVKYMRMPE